MYYTFPLWKPNAWIPFCITLDVENKTYRTFVNNEIVFETYVYNGTHLANDMNIILMNSRMIETGNYDNHFITPFHGQLTDINIWDRILSNEEVDTWSECGQVSGKYLDWSNAKVDHSPHIIISNIDEVCEGRKVSKFIAFDYLLQFKDSLKFCQNLGGEVAVAEDETYVAEMKAALMVVRDRTSSSCSETVYSGYRFKDGTHRSINSEDEMTWTVINPNFNFNDCVLLDIDKETFKKERCQTKTCPICHFSEWPTEIHLRGISLEEAENMDSSYYLVNSSHLIGKTKSLIINKDHNWNIYNSNNKLVFFNKFEAFPLGVNEWSFNKTTNKYGWTHILSHNKGNNNKTLKLHRAVNQPGNFCCLDGSCIPSGILKFY